MKDVEPQILDEKDVYCSFRVGAYATLEDAIHPAQVQDDTTRAPNHV